MNKTISAKKAMILIGLTAILTASLFAGVFATTTSRFMTLSGGIYPGANQITIGITETNLIYAKDAYGVVLDSATELGVLLNNMFDVLGDDGGRIVLMTGVYSTKTPIKIDVDNIELTSERGAIIKQALNYLMDALINVDNANNVYLHGLYLDASDTPATREAIGIFVNGSSARGRISDCMIFNLGAGVIISSNNANKWVISRNHIENVYDEGIALIEHTTRGYIIRSDCIITENTIKATGYHGILVSGLSGNVVSNNIVEDAGSVKAEGFAHGIALDGNAGDSPQDHNTVTGNNILNSRMKGIENADASDWVTITGNTIKVAGEGGIYTGGYLYPSLNAVITNNLVYGAQWDGIIFENASYASATGNLVRNCSSSGILVLTSYDISLTGNEVIDNHGTAGITISRSTNTVITGGRALDISGSSQEWGIYEYPTCYNTLITGFNARDSLWGGMYLSGTAWNIAFSWNGTQMITS